MRASDDDDDESRKNQDEDFPRSTDEDVERLRRIDRASRKREAELRRKLIEQPEGGNKCNGKNQA